MYEKIFPPVYKINGNWVLIEEWEQNTFTGYQEQKYVRANSTFVDYIVLSYDEDNRKKLIANPPDKNKMIQMVKGQEYIFSIM